MTDMLGRATAAASNAWHESETCPGEMYAKEACIVAQAALLAALDVEDEKLVNMLRDTIDSVGICNDPERGPCAYCATGAADSCLGIARAAIAAINAYAQGVSVSQEQVREKDT